MAPTASAGRSVVLPARESDFEQTSTPEGRRISCILLAAALVLAMRLGDAAAASSATGETLEVGELTERYGSAVVTIRVKTGREGITRQGSGFLVDGSGIVITTLHLLEDAEKALVKTAGKKRFEQIQIRAYDVASDLAILQVAGRDLPAVLLGESGSVKAGDTVTVIGNPLGLAQTVTKGIVSAWRQPPPLPEDLGWEEKKEDEEFGLRRRLRALPDVRILQIAAPIAPGSSGAPVFDRGGRVIGVAVAGISYGEMELNFAIPASAILPLLDADQRMTLESLHEQVDRDREVRAEPHLENARLALELGDEAEAQREVDVALQIFPDSVEGLLLESELLERAGDLQSAERSVHRATEQDPDSAEVWSRLGELLLEDGQRLREAEDSFERALELDSEHARAAYGLGLVLLKKGRLRRASILLRHAVKVDEGLTPAHLQLGEIYLRVGQFPEAEDAFQAALEADLGNAVAHRGLAFVYLGIGQEERARHRFQDFLELSEDDPELEDLRERTIIYLRRYPRLMPLKLQHLLEEELLPQ